MQSVINEYKLMSSIQKPKPVEKEKKKESTPDPELSNVDNMINNAKEIDELRELLV